MCFDTPEFPMISSNVLFILCVVVMSSTTTAILRSVLGFTTWSTGAYGVGMRNDFLSFYFFFFLFFYVHVCLFNLLHVNGVLLSYIASVIQRLYIVMCQNIIQTPSPPLCALKEIRNQPPIEKPPYSPAKRLNLIRHPSTVLSLGRTSR